MRNMENQEKKVDLRRIDHDKRLPPAHTIRRKNVVAEIWANPSGRGFRYSTIISHAYVGHHGVGLTRVLPEEDLSHARWVAYKAEKWIRKEKRKTEILRSLFHWMVK